MRHGLGLFTDFLDEGVFKTGQGGRAVFLTQSATGLVVFITRVFLFWVQLCTSYANQVLT